MSTSSETRDEVSSDVPDDHTHACDAPSHGYILSEEVAEFSHLVPNRTPAIQDASTHGRPQEPLAVLDRASAGQDAPIHGNSGGFPNTPIYAGTESSSELAPESSPCVTRLQQIQNAARNAPTTRRESSHEVSESSPGMSGPSDDHDHSTFSQASEPPLWAAQARDKIMTKIGRMQFSLANLKVESILQELAHLRTESAQIKELNQALMREIVSLRAQVVGGVDQEMTAMREAVAEGRRISCRDLDLLRTGQTELVDIVVALEASLTTSIGFLKVNVLRELRMIRAEAARGESSIHPEVATKADIRELGAVLGAIQIYLHSQSEFSSQRTDASASVDGTVSDSQDLRSIPLPGGAITDDASSGYPHDESSTGTVTPRAGPWRDEEQSEGDADSDDSDRSKTTSIQQASHGCSSKSVGKRPMVYDDAAADSDDSSRSKATAIQEASNWSSSNIVGQRPMDPQSEPMRKKRMAIGEDMADFEEAHDSKRQMGETATARSLKSRRAPKKYETC